MPRYVDNAFRILLATIALIIAKQRLFYRKYLPGCITKHVAATLSKYLCTIAVLQGFSRLEANANNGLCVFVVRDWN